MSYTGVNTSKYSSTTVTGGSMNVTGVPAPHGHGAHKGMSLHVDPTVNPNTGQIHTGLREHNTEDDLRGMGYNPNL